jgi:hypothetical protein
LPGVFGRDDTVGLIFSKVAGFIDIGHVRDNIDMTKYYYDQLRSSRAAKGKSFASAALLAKATVTITQDIVKPEFISVARSMAYDDSVYHEIDSWRKTGDRISAFSPEDLTSNHIGTWVGATVLTNMPGSGRDFDTQVTMTLPGALNSLQPVSTTDTTDMIDNVYSRGWFQRRPNSKTDFASMYLKGTYLQRRNFSIDTITPWFPYPGPYPPLPAGLTHSWGSPTPARKYQITYYSGESSETPKMTTDDFAGQVKQITSEAKAQFGADADKP